MELKVWVEGIQRIVCGVTVNTTCQDVVFALAHATGKVGRFTLIERWRNNERLLAPHDNPLRILLKWGEHSNDVQFILQRSERRVDDKPGVHTTPKNKEPVQTDSNQNAVVTDFLPLGRNKEARKSFGLSNDTKHIENVGIVKGIPQKTTTKTPPMIKSIPGKPSKVDSTTIVNETFRFATSNNEFNVADLRNSLDRTVNGNKIHQHDHRKGASGDSFSAESSNSSNNKVSLANNNAPPISSNGALVPPPYRDPPPPRTSPQQQNKAGIAVADPPPTTSRRIEHKDSINMTAYYNVNELMDLNENSFQNAQHKDLVQLLKYQREKLSSQQTDMSKYDAEIGYLENKEKDQIEVITKEINKTEAILRQGSEQLQSLQYVEEDNELVRQQEKTLKSEITLLRSKLANCETELLQCKNKIRLLLDDIQIEQRSLNSRQKDKRQQVERNILAEIERIQLQVDETVQKSETASKAADNLKKEIGSIENAIAEKKKQVEKLVKEMKEVNLQSLTVAPSDEIRHLLEASNKPGSTRRIIGSPRQLENAVPTSRNPHGVWV